MQAYTWLRILVCRGISTFPRLARLYPRTAAGPSRAKSQKIKTFHRRKFPWIDEKIFPRALLIKKNVHNHRATRRHFEIAWEFAIRETLLDRYTISSFVERNGSLYRETAQKMYRYRYIKHPRRLKPKRELQILLSATYTRVKHPELTGDACHSVAAIVSQPISIPRPHHLHRHNPLIYLWKKRFRPRGNVMRGISVV